MDASGFFGALDDQPDSRRVLIRHARYLPGGATANRDRESYGLSHSGTADRCAMAGAASKVAVVRMAMPVRRAGERSLGAREGPVIPIGPAVRLMALERAISCAAT